MAVDFQKALDNLTTKLKGKSISKTYIKNAATRYAAKIETDADIDDYINERLDDIIEAGVEADRRVNAALKKVEKPDPTKKETDIEIDEDELKDAPAYVKAMMKQMQGMNETIQTFQKEKTAASVADRFLKHDKLKNIPAKLLKGLTPKELKDDDELETLVSETYEDLKEFETNGSGGSGGNTGGVRRSGNDRPGFGGSGQQQQGGAGGGKTEATDAVKAFTATLNKQTVQK